MKFYRFSAKQMVWWYARETPRNFNIFSLFSMASLNTWQKWIFIRSIIISILTTLQCFLYNSCIRNLWVDFFFYNVVEKKLKTLHVGFLENIPKTLTHKIPFTDGNSISFSSNFSIWLFRSITHRKIFTIQKISKKSFLFSSARVHCYDHLVHRLLKQNWMVFCFPKVLLSFIYIHSKNWKNVCEIDSERASLNCKVKILSWMKWNAFVTTKNIYLHENVVVAAFINFHVDRAILIYIFICKQSSLQQLLTLNITIISKTL